MLKGYARLIADAIGTEDLPTLALVEELMRADRCSLDNLGGHEFAALARQAAVDAHTMAQAGQLDFYCETLGLAVPGWSRTYLN